LGGAAGGVAGSIPILNPACIQDVRPGCAGKSYRFGAVAESGFEQSITGWKKDGVRDRFLRATTDAIVRPHKASARPLLIDAVKEKKSG
jgi:hypothetical protein